MLALIHLSIKYCPKNIDTTVGDRKTSRLRLSHLRSSFLQHQDLPHNGLLFVHIHRTRLAKKPSQLVTLKNLHIHDLLQSAYMALIPRLFLHY